jgi:hypothetical protein
VLFEPVRPAHAQGQSCASSLQTNSYLSTEMKQGQPFEQFRQ